MRTPNLSPVTPRRRTATARRAQRQRAPTRPSVASERIAARELERRRGFRKAHYLSRADLQAGRSGS